MVKEEYLAFCMANGKTKCKNIAQASEVTGIPVQTLYTISKRGVSGTDQMIDLANAFEVDTEVAYERISLEVRKRLSEKRHTKIAS